jgi:D-arabinose 1-dehydrogenase-like Zn-dependent alcohol dehydrogenase
MNYKSFWHLKNNQSEIISETLEMSNLDKIQIESLYSSISLGTEKIVAQGKVPSSLYEKMAVPYQRGTFEFPIQYGYSLVGKNKKNQLVHLMHPHQTSCFVNEKDCFVCEKETKAVLATQLSNMETVINAIWVSKVKPKQKVLVCGLGSIGVLLAETLQKYCKALVFVKETNEYKLDFLAEKGFLIAKENQEFSLCFHVSANQNGLQYCIDHSSKEGKIIELSWYGTREISIRLGENFHYNRLQIISSQVSEIPLEKTETEDFLSRKKLAEKLLQRIPIQDYISLIAFDDLPEFFKNTPKNHFITVVKY